MIDLWRSEMLLTDEEIIQFLEFLNHFKSLQENNQKLTLRRVSPESIEEFQDDRKHGMRWLRHNSILVLCMLTVKEFAETLTRQ